MHFEVSSVYLALFFFNGMEWQISCPTGAKNENLDFLDDYHVVRSHQVGQCSIAWLFLYLSVLIMFPNNLWCFRKTKLAMRSGFQSVENDLPSIDSDVWFRSITC